jgi:hypothetical protein
VQTNAGAGPNAWVPPPPKLQGALSMLAELSLAVRVA